MEHSLHYGEFSTRSRDRVERMTVNNSRLNARARWKLAFKAVLRDFVQTKSFRYSFLGPGQIRILHLEPGERSEPIWCSLFSRQLSDVDGSYEALSYCWGSPNETLIHDIKIRDLNAALPPPRVHDGRLWKPILNTISPFRFPIRRNLFQALIHLRDRVHPVMLWVDAICINQSDRGEKAEQIRMMAAIYRSAFNVCIWLGDSSEQHTDGVRLVREIMDFRTFDDLIQTRMAKDRWANLIQVMKLPWFTRRWVIQEVAMARNASIHFAGDYGAIIHWDDFADAVSLLCEKVEILRSMFKDDLFENVEFTSASLLVQTISNVCRKSNNGIVLANLLDLETLVSTLMAFQATFPRDAIYSVLSLARDPPQETEDGTVAVTVDYDTSTRDLFIAFVIRCIQTSKCLDIICRHWAPPVADKLFKHVAMPSWVSGLSNAQFGIPWESSGRQNGQNFVALSAFDKRKIYNASGTYEARARLVDSDDPSGDLDILQINEMPITQSSTNNSFSEVPSSLERSPSPRAAEKSVPIHKKANTNSPSSNSTAKLPLTGRVGPDFPIIDETGNRIGTQTPHAFTAGELGGTFTLNMSAIISEGAPAPGFDVASEIHTPAPLAIGRRSPSSIQNEDPLSRLKAKQPALLLQTSSKYTMVPDVEREHRLSGTLSAQGFVLGTIKEQSDVMRGGIVPGDWLPRLGWIEESHQNSVPDMLWRILVADRGPGGIKPPRWYQRACLHCLIDARITDANGNLCSAKPREGRVAEMISKFLKRVEDVVWNRRLFEADAVMAAHGGRVFGLAPKEADVGDAICILLGCSVPVVLRKVLSRRSITFDHYLVVGEAYVHGMMEGEAVSDAMQLDGPGFLKKFYLS